VLVFTPPIIPGSYEIGGDTIMTSRQSGNAIVSPVLLRKSAIEEFRMSRCGSNPISPAFLDTYRTLCLAPTAQIRNVF
jgi:hypothetical protein